MGNNQDNQCLLRVASIPAALRCTLKCLPLEVVSEQPQLLWLQTWLGRWGRILKLTVKPRRNLTLRPHNGLSVQPAPPWFSTGRRVSSIMQFNKIVSRSFLKELWNPEFVPDNWLRIVFLWHIHSTSINLLWSKRYKKGYCSATGASNKQFC